MADQRTATEVAHAHAVREMFSGIARRYDLLNHVLSLNIDKRWRRLVRRQLLEVLDREEATVLDVACGTGDLSIELKRGAKSRVVGSDFCRPMLEIAREKTAEIGLSIPYVKGDALDLPFDDFSFDAVTIAFGLRNLSSFASGLSELRRVLKHGGKLVILEFSTPLVPGFRGLFRLYFTEVLPRIGGLISGSRGAYEYLPDSVSKFPDQKTLAGLLQETGFSEVSFMNLTGGIAALHSGTRS